MDSSTLRRFAEEGFRAVPGHALADLAVWCRDYCEISGDARYCSIGEALRRVDEWRTEYDESGGVPTALLSQIDHVVRRDLPAILDAATPADGSLLARGFREEVTGFLLPPERWPES